MAYVPRILAFAGSTRTESFNKKLLKIAIRGAEAAGAQITHLDLHDLALPLYDGDLEASSGLPAGARRLKDLMLANDGFLISSPEYNSSIPGVLKNAIDWASRPSGTEPALAPFNNKVAVLMSASPGALGGLRGLITVRSIFENLKTIVLPEQIAVSHANEAFNSDGSLKDAKQQAGIEGLGKRLADFLTKLNH